MAKKKATETTTDSEELVVVPTTEVVEQAQQFTQSTKEVEIEIVKDFSTLKVGDKVTVSENVAEILIHKKLAK